MDGFQTKFDELNINKKLKSCLHDMDMIEMTPIQKKCIPHFLNGKDLLGTAKTGSGKTLAFLVPLIEKIMKEPVTRDIGTVAIIVSPTRELSRQTFEVLEQLIAGSSLRIGIITGGTNITEEASELAKGLTVLVATPGRLLDHLNRTKDFKYSGLHTLVIDEADKLVDVGFLEDMRAILKKLPKQRQTVLISATLNVTAYQLRKRMKAVETVESTKKKKQLSIEEKVLTLACISLGETCVCVNTIKEEANGSSIVENLTQKYIYCFDDERFRILYTIIQNKTHKKVIVFMSTCLEVQFYYQFFKFIKTDDENSVPILALHGQQVQRKREKNLEIFKEEESAVLLCTDIAARGLDIEQVDLVVQYDPPDDHKEYIHRVGRTARAGRSGEALIFLRKAEMGFLAVLRTHNIKLSVFNLPASSIRPIQDALETIIASVGELRQMALDAFPSVVSAYTHNRIKDCFDIAQLDLVGLAKNFGLGEAPHVTIKSNTRATKKKKSSAATKKTTMKRPGTNSQQNNSKRLKIF